MAPKVKIVSPSFTYHYKIVQKAHIIMLTIFSNAKRCGEQGEVPKEKMQDNRQW